jgi:signal transduction histidine kinase
MNEQYEDEITPVSGYRHSLFLDYSIIVMSISYISSALIYYFIYDAIILTKVILAHSITIPIYFAVKKLSKKIYFQATCILVSQFTFITSVSLHSGGPNSQVFWWYLIIPILATLLTGPIQTITWTLMIIMSYSVFFFGNPERFFVNELSGQDTSIFQFYSLSFMMLVITLTCMTLEFLRKKTQKENIKITATSAQNSHLQALGEMAGGVAHEINNPLAIISGSANVIKKHLLRNNVDKDKLLKHVEVINKTVRRATHIIHGMKNLSRDGKEDSYEVFPIGEAFSDVFSFMSKKIQIQNIDLQYNEKDLVLLKPISFQRVQLSQVILNLINNACDAVFEQKGEKWIKVEFISRSEYIEVQVSNSGPVIPKNVRAKIFNPLFTTKPVGKGTGLGLSLCHSIMTKNQGNIFLCRDSQYTTFILSIPIATHTENIASVA